MADLTREEREQIHREEKLKVEQTPWYRRSADDLPDSAKVWIAILGAAGAVWVIWDLAIKGW